MKLEKVILKNVRGFSGTHEIPISSLTTFVGKNDAGKSTVLDSLGVFFGHPLCKFDASDVCVHADDSGEVRIGCVFSDLPDKLVLDATVETSLTEEYLEVHKVWPIKEDGLGRAKTVVVANHPTADGCADLLQAKRPALRAQVKKLGLENETNCNSNPAMRQAIWKSSDDLQLASCVIQIDKEDAKAIGEQLQKHFPDFALFRADRPSTDEDAEVQDPLKVAVQQAIGELESDLETFKDKVRKRALDVAERTLTKLNDFDESLAKKLEPKFSKALKWDSLFKLSLDGDDGISINKRGSGVRRLVLFSFFQAEAERLRQQNAKNNIIYAIEEPETAQHPSNQKKVIEALIAISETDGSQVMLTTHVPGLAGMVPVDSIRHISAIPGPNRQVAMGNDEVFKTIADELGVLPDKRAQVIVCVEGPTDIKFLKRISRILRQNDSSLPDLESDPRIAMILMGGQTLEHWVNDHLLRNLGLPEIHIYDRDLPKSDGTHKYQSSVDQLNARGDGSQAFLTQKREIENYLHPDAIFEAFNGHIETEVRITIGEETDVTTVIETLIGQRKVKRRALKNWLNEEAAENMTMERLRERDADGEISSWLSAIKSKLTN